MMIFFNLHKGKLMIPEGSSCIRAVFSGGKSGGTGKRKWYLPHKLKGKYHFITGLQSLLYQTEGLHLILIPALDGQVILTECAECLDEGTGQA